MHAKQKIKIGISSCLLGHNVRYDGGNRLDQFPMNMFGPIVEWVPICPETEGGLPVPREPMQLIDDGRRIRLLTIDTKIDLTDTLTGWIEGKLMQLERMHISGFVFKARSPSCGVRDTVFFSASGAFLGTRPGLFAEAVKGRFPSLPVEDEEALRDPVVRRKFLARILA